MRITVLRGCLLAGAVALVSMTAASAQQGRPQQNEEILPALLTEVRGLRAAMEQMAAAGPRVQLALGRLQLQEQRINTMLRRLETIREVVGGAQRDSSQMELRIAEMEEALKTADRQPNTEEFTQNVASEIKAMKLRLATASAETLRLQSEEATLQQQIATEQARWSDINRQLEELERALGRR